MHLWRLLVLGGLWGASLVTVIGFAAPWVPQVELANQLRHLTAAGCLLTMPIAWTVSRKLSSWAMALAAVNVAVIAAAVAAAPLAGEASEASDGAPLRVMTFNVWRINEAPEKIAHALASSGADVIALQEMDGREADILDALRDAYPYQAHCAEARRCRLALLSRHPLSETVARTGERSRPPTIRAALSLGDRAIDIVVVHTMQPRKAGQQAAEFDWLGQALLPGARPMVVMGDFNATPWSWLMVRLGRATGLGRVGTRGATWPAPFATYGLLFPFVLIDHVLVSRDVAVRRWWIGPPAGSDHLPVVADLRIGG